MHVDSLSLFLLGVLALSLVAFTVVSIAYLRILQRARLADRRTRRGQQWA